MIDFYPNLPTEIEISALSAYNVNRLPKGCVRPTSVRFEDIDENGHLPMCGNPITHVGVRKDDGWVSSTMWCEDHVATDTSEPWDYFVWRPLKF